jgi:hypothetical protein
MDPLPSEPPPPRGSGRILLIGGAIALIAGLAIAFALLMGGRGERTPPPPASEGGLVIEQGEETGKIDAAKPLRCFVAGQFVGDLTLSECARRNGVATDALDVGLDPSGALAAAPEAGVNLTPLPPEEAEAPVVEEGPQPPAPAPAEAAPPRPAAAPAGCWRHNRGQWTRLPGEMDLNACVQSLFAGKCERAGAADYGRWGGQTLRLVTGRVEVSSDNQTFRTLAAQQPGCVIPPLG